MAMSTSSGSPTPGAPDGDPHRKVALALYNHFRDNFDVGHIFTQKDVEDTNIIPGNDIGIILGAATFLVKNHLFKIHNVATTGNPIIGWELISEKNAHNYTDLNQHEAMILSAIENQGSAGIWTKRIKEKSGVPSKEADKALKTLESKKLITQMKSVRFPQRKMYIAAGLTPNEEATGGAWFTDGVLDEELVETIADAIESIVARKSWKDTVLSADPGSGETHSSSNPKRKIPEDGFDIKAGGKAKAMRIDDDQPQSATPEPVPAKSKIKPSHRKIYQAYSAKHTDYPTAREISTTINKLRISNTSLPQNAIDQLLQVMVYDDRLYKLYRAPLEDETPDAFDGLHVTMFRSTSTPDQVHARLKRIQRARDPRVDTISRKAAVRAQELEDIGYGGATEVPCLRCPVIHLCEDEGPVNVDTCRYFDDWFKKIDDANRAEHENGKSTRKEGAPTVQDEDDGGARVAHAVMVD